MHAPVPMNLFFRSPWVAALVGGIGALAFGFLGWGFWQDYSAFSSSAEPTSTSLAELAKRPAGTKLWATLSDARLHCEGAVASDTQVYVPITDPTGVWHAVATYDKQHFDCWQLLSRPVVGLLHPMDTDKLGSLIKAGMDVTGQPTGSPILELRAAYTKEDSRNGLFFCLGMGLLMGLFYPLWAAFTRTRYGRRSAAMWGVTDGTATAEGATESPLPRLK